MIDYLQNFLDDTTAFLTDPNGIGFPILIAVGLGIILYLIHFTTKEEKKAQISIDQSKDYDKYNNRKMPFKPF